VSIEPGWYPDPAEPTTKRYWDGEGWIGAAIPVDATPPAGPPPVDQEPALPAPPVPAPAPAPAVPQPVTPAWPGAPEPGRIAYPPGYPGAHAPGRAAVPRPHGLLLASVGARFVARLVDVLAVLVLCVIANAWLAVQLWRGVEPYVTEVIRRAAAGDRSTDGLPTPADSTSTLIFMILLATTAVWFAYEVPGSANSGQTLGKRLLGIKVVRVESEERLGFGRAFRRWGRLGLPTLLWYCCGAGFLLQVIDCLFVTIDRPLRQALHDKAANTVVVRVPRRSGGDPAELVDASAGGRRADQS
jgi:uncharacterized RDD family membrane protein YckC